MALITIDTGVAASADHVWDALRDWGALHERLAPGFAVATVVDGSDRLVTFFNGVTLRERILEVDDDQRRLVWSIVDGPYSQHKGTAEVRATDDGALFSWTAEVAPDETAARTREMMERGSAAIKAALEAGPGPASKDR
jgi:Polyketide cyclase / dehydrase and lipid transport